MCVRWGLKGIWKLYFHQCGFFFWCLYFCYELGFFCAGKIRRYLSFSHSPSSTLSSSATKISDMKTISNKPLSAFLQTTPFFLFRISNFNLYLTWKLKRKSQPFSSSMIFRKTQIFNSFFFLIYFSSAKSANSSV